MIRAIIDNSTAVIYVKDLQGRYLLVNRRYSELFHISNETVAGKTDHDLFPQDVAESVRAMDLRVAAAATTLTEEEVVPHDDGPHTYISVKCPLWDETGKPYAVFGISTDITDRKHAEEALRASEERTRLIVETALDAVITIDSGGVITGWSPQADRVFGWTRQEVLGRLLTETIIPHNYREAHGRGLNHYLATGEGPVLNKRIELTALHCDGHEFPVELSITPIRTGDTQVFSAFVRDITERKLAEAKAHAQLERLDLLRQITRSIGERQDLGSIYQVVLRSLEENMAFDFGCICNYDALSQELTVLHVGVRSQSLALELALTEQARIPMDANGLSQCVGGQVVYEPDIAQVTMPFPQKLAAAGLRSLVAAPLIVESKVFGVVVAARRERNSFSSGECEFLRQVSEHAALAAHQAQLHAALQQAYDDLRESQQAVMQQERLRALGQMASGIAHDINNALSPVSLYTESLLEDEPSLSERARRYLGTIQQAIGDVAQTVMRMREFYRQREPELTLAPVDLNLLVQQVLDFTRARWYDMPQQRGVAIQVDRELAPGLPAVLGVDNEIREALINLIFNAVDAMPEGGTMTVRTNVVGTDPGGPDGGPPLRHVDVEVADTGLGMDEETKRRCLEPFFTTKGERGTGLGLAMVYGVVQRHSAELEIESVVGKGTTVRLVFPADPANVRRPATSTAAHTTVSRLRILIVDDDPVLLKSLCDTLESDGHVVTTANSGQQGIDTFRAKHAHAQTFDVVITDLGMPHIDGSRVSSAVKTLSSTTPVILLTGWGQRLVAEGEVPPHVDRVLNKPPKLRELREALATCCQPKSGSPEP
jgi:PAS domain S-box-containing protein